MLAIRLGLFFESKRFKSKPKRTKQNQGNSIGHLAKEKWRKV
jgi:hypothetical protein